MKAARHHVSNMAVSPAVSIVRMEPWCAVTQFSDNGFPPAEGCDNPTLIERKINQRRYLWSGMTGRAETC